MHQTAFTLRRLKRGLLLCGALLLFHLSWAQYYPQLQPANENSPASHILQLGQTAYYRPSRTKQELSQAAEYARKSLLLSERTHDTSVRTKSILLSAYLRALTHDFGVAEQSLSQLNDRGKIDLLLRLGFEYTSAEADDIAANLKRAIGLFQQADQLSVKLGDPASKLLARQGIAYVHSRQQTPGAEKELLDIVSDYRRTGNRRLQYPYMLLCNYYYFTADPPNALLYAHEAVKAALLTQDSAALGDAYWYQALVCLDNDDYAKALQYATNSVEVYRRYPGQFFWMGHRKLPFLLVWICDKMGQPRRSLEYSHLFMHDYPPTSAIDSMAYWNMIGNSYRNMKDFETAEAMMARSYTIANRVGYNLFTTSRDLGQVYVEAHRFAKAIPYLQRASQYGGPSTPLFVQRHLRYMIFLADSATGNWQKAVNDQNQFKGIDDSTRYKAQDRELSRLRVAYEVEQKENEIKLKNQQIQLLDQQTRAEHARLKQANMVQGLTVGSTLLLLVIAVLLYRNNREKKRMTQTLVARNDTIHQKNEILEHLLKEKDILLKEVHHRVKNNLQTVSCLLEGQADFLEDDALRAIESSQHRIYAMSLVHQRLYQSEDIATVDMQHYLSDLVNFLSDSFAMTERIRVHCDVDPICLGVGKAIPVALIINEGVTNAIKYAFGNGDPGNIWISLKENGTAIMLEVIDDGIGIGDVNVDKAGSFGIQLMRGLALEIDGTLQIRQANGTAISLIFENATALDNSPLDKITLS